MLVVVLVDQPVVADTVPDLLAALGNREKIEIAASQYDDLFVVVPKAGGAPTVVRLKY